MEKHQFDKLYKDLDMIYEGLNILSNIEKNEQKNRMIDNIKGVAIRAIELLNWEKANKYQPNRQTVPKFFPFYPCKHNSSWV